MLKCIKHCFLAIASLLTACSFPSPLGEDIVQSEILDIVFIDTIGIRLSTVLFDSIVTSNKDRHLIGYHQDNEVGAVTSATFTQFTLDSIQFPDDDARYEYAELVLLHDGYYHYDTSTSFSVNIHSLTEEIELNDEGYLSNLSEFRYDRDKVLGTTTVEPRPFSDNEITVEINHLFAQALFNAAIEQDQSDFIDDFQELFPGIVIFPDTTVNGAFLGFSPLSKLVIHYRESGEDEELVFPLNGLRFNQIINDRSQTNLDQLSTLKEDLTSVKTGNQAHLHNGIGMAIKVEIPFLREIRSTLQSNFITEANLILRPIKTTYSTQDPLPGTLIFSEVDKLNRVENTLNVAGGLVVDAEFDEDTEYRIQITDFIQEKIDESTLEEHSILVQGSSQTLGISVDQLVVGDRFSEYEAKLELFILDYIIEN